MLFHDSLCGYISQSDYHQDRAWNYYSNSKFQVQRLVSCLTRFTWCGVGDFLCFASFAVEYQYQKINQWLIVNAKTPKMLKDRTFWINNRFLEAEGKETQRSKKIVKFDRLWHCFWHLINLHCICQFLFQDFLLICLQLANTSHVTLSSTFTSRHCLVTEAALWKGAWEDVSRLHITSV